MNLSCSNFPSGLPTQDKFVIDSVATPWRSQCPDHKYVTAVWSSKPSGLPEDMKCCLGAPDHVLSYVLLDLHHQSNGSYGENQKWPVECPGNSVVTGKQSKIICHLWL